MKLYLKLYLCLDSSKTQICYNLVDKFNGFILSTLKNYPNKNIRYRFSNKQKDLVFSSYLNSDAAFEFEEKFKGDWDTMYKYQQSPNQIKTEILHIFGKEIVYKKQIDFDEFLKNIQKKISIFSKHYSQSFNTKISLLYDPLRSTPEQKKVLKYQELINFYHRIKIFLAYIIFYDKLLEIDEIEEIEGIDEIEDDKKAQAIVTQKEIAKGDKVSKSDLNKNSTEKTEKTERIEPESNWSVNPTQKQKPDLKTQVTLTDSQGYGTFIHVNPITKAAGNKKDKCEQHQVSNKEQMLQEIKEEKAAAEAAKVEKATSEAEKVGKAGKVGKAKKNAKKKRKN